MEPADLDIGLEDLIQAVEGFRPAGDDADPLRTAVTSAEGLDDPEGLSARALAAQGLAAAEVRAAVDAASPAAAQSLPAHIPFAAEGKKVLENALREAFSRRHNYIGTEHLLLGLLAERRSAGAKLLRQLGASQEATAEWIDAALADLVARKRSPGS